MPHPCQYYHFFKKHYFKNICLNIIFPCFLFLYMSVILWTTYSCSFHVFKTVCMIFLINFQTTYILRAITISSYIFNFFTISCMPLHFILFDVTILFLILCSQINISFCFNAMYRKYFSYPIIYKHLEVFLFIFSMILF